MHPLLDCIIYLENEMLLFCFSEGNVSFLLRQFFKIIFDFGFQKFYYSVVR